MSRDWGGVARLSAALAIAALGSALFAPIARADGQAERYPEIKADLEAEGYFELGPDGTPKKNQIDLEMEYLTGVKRKLGRRKEKLNVYQTTGGVSVAHPPAEVIEALVGFDAYHAWALDGLNDIRLHPDYPKEKSWNFELVGISNAKGGPGLSLDVQVFKFGRGGITLREVERDAGADGAPSLIHLTLGGRNLFVKHFTFTFFIFPINDGKGSAIRFENEVGLRAPVDWFFRDSARNPVASTKPRVARFLENLTKELDRKAAAAADAEVIEPSAGSEANADTKPEKPPARATPF